MVPAKFDRFLLLCFAILFLEGLSIVCSREISGDPLSRRIDVLALPTFRLGLQRT